jgi:peroxin-7
LRTNKNLSRLKAMRQLSLLYTANQQCYNIKYSPFDNSILACVSCDKFGISASASLNILQYKERSFLDSKFSIIESFRYKTCIFDVDWSPVDSSLILTANGDGTVALWKYPLINTFERKPVFIQKKHNKEVYSVQWEPSGMRSYHFLSASWDQTIKIWNMSNTGLTELTSLTGHQGMIYTGAWNPKMSGIVISGSADKTFRVWDVNSSTINSTPIFISQPNTSDVLCCDWSKFDENIFALGYASGLIEIRDFRNLSAPPLKSIQMAHDYAIKKIRFSPHLPNLFGTVSYDMNTKLWDMNSPNAVLDAKNHSEFTYGLDFDPKLPNRFVDCGWDKRVVINEFNVNLFAQAQAIY